MIHIHQPLHMSHWNILIIWWWLLFYIFYQLSCFFFKCDHSFIFVSSEECLWFYYFFYIYFNQWMMIEVWDWLNLRFFFVIHEQRFFYIVVPVVVAAFNRHMSFTVDTGDGLQFSFWGRNKREKEKEKNCWEIIK